MEENEHPPDSALDPFLDVSVPFQVADPFPFPHLAVHSIVEEAVKVLVQALVVVVVADGMEGVIVVERAEDEGVQTAVAARGTVEAADEQSVVELVEVAVDEIHLDQTALLAVGLCRAGLCRELLRPSAAAAAVEHKDRVDSADSAQVPPSIRVGCSPSS